MTTSEGMSALLSLILAMVLWAGASGPLKPPTDCLTISAVSLQPDFGLTAACVDTVDEEHLAGTPPGAPSPTLHGIPPARLSRLASAIAGWSEHRIPAYALASNYRI